MFIVFAHKYVLSFLVKQCLSVYEYGEGDGVIYIVPFTV